MFPDKIDSRNKQKIDKSNSNYSWQRGLGLFFQLSGWLVGPLVIALFLGRWLDNRYQTEPWLFLLSVGVAFAIACLGIVRETMKFIKQIEKEAEDKNLKKKENGSLQSD